MSSPARASPIQNSCRRHGVAGVHAASATWKASPASPYPIQKFLPPPWCRRRPRHLRHLEGESREPVPDPKILATAMVSPAPTPPPALGRRVPRGRRRSKNPCRRHGVGGIHNPRGPEIIPRDLTRKLTTDLKFLPVAMVSPAPTPPPALGCPAPRGRPPIQKTLVVAKVGPASTPLQRHPNGTQETLTEPSAASRRHKKLPLITMVSPWCWRRLRKTPTTRNSSASLPRERHHRHVHVGVHTHRHPENLPRALPGERTVAMLVPASRRRATAVTTAMAVRSSERQRLRPPSGINRRNQK